MTLPVEPAPRTYTFLYTDLEGSTALWERSPAAMEAALPQHDRILRDAIDAHGGAVFRTVGDGICAVFANASSAVAAAVEAQRKIQTTPWGEIGVLRVRMVLHTGEAEARNGDYLGSSLNRIGRMLAITHGGQTLLSQATQLLVRGSLPAGVDLRDLGEVRLRDLSYPEHVFQLQHPDLPAAFPPLVSLDRQPNNLPTQTTTLIGRETELAEVIHRLESDPVRLLTLTGPGGTGKTRLALQAAADLIGRFEDGVYFVDLAPVDNPGAVLQVLARTINVRETSDRPILAELTERLRAKRMLLLLDNFEQVTAAASQVVALLQACPQLKFLVTSREALHVRGEVIYPVPPLELPKFDHKPLPVEQLTQYEAVRLFIERAQAVKPNFNVTNENAPAVAEICVRLDGLPLAIELAAARVNLFPPQALLERLGSSLKLLRGGPRDLPARQQTLRDTIDWSYQLLDAGERQLFALLSVFAGCSFEAVEGVASRIERLDEIGGDIVDGLTSLLEKSLIRQTDQEGGEPRFWMLETIHEYAAQRLGEDPAFYAAACRAHAVYFAEFAQGQWGRLTGGERDAALAGLAIEIENIRAAWRYWVGERDLEQLGRLVDSLWMLYDTRGWYHATVELTTDLLDVLAATPSTPERAQEELMLRTSLARALLAVKGYTPEVEAAFLQALELSKTGSEIPQLYPALRSLSSFYMFLGQFDKALRFGEQILGLGERYADPGMRVEGNLVMGASLSMTKNPREGLGILEKGIAEFDPERQPVRRFRLGNSSGVACYTTSAILLWVLGFPDRARQRAREAIDAARRLNHPYSLAYAFHHASLVAIWLREADHTREYAQAAIDIAQEYEFAVWEAVGTCLHGAALAGLGSPKEGLAEFRRGMQIYQGLKTPPIFVPMLLSIQAGVAGQAGEIAEGLSSIDNAIQVPNTGFYGPMAGEFSRLKGELLLAQSAENEHQAEGLFQDAVNIARDLNGPMLELRAAMSLARLWGAQGKRTAAQELLSKAYANMTEGFTTADLVDAKALLEMLG